MELIPLGTSSASIVKSRGQSAYAIRANRDIFLFDCGDGTQYQLLRAGISHMRIRVIFITHLHGDHYLGIFGLLMSMSLERRERKLIIVAPQGLSTIINSISGLKPEDLTYPIQYINIEEGFESGEVYQHERFRVSAHCLDHGIFCIGYRVEKDSNPAQIDGKLAIRLGVTEPEQFKRLVAGEVVELSNGKMISPDQVRKDSTTVFAYVSDTRPCSGGLALADHADLMIHEATFSQTDMERARETGHSTALDAAHVAKKANTKQLLLTHFSSRYRDVTVLEDEARSVFSDSEIAQEFRVYPIKPDPLPISPIL
ncbi:MAG: ribonuclease Z [Bacteroidetes bacterium]|nr:ribonuclease Z [Bacteroidota bacterium]